MSKENPTFLETGIKVYISKEELELLKNGKPGFLDRECYPEFYKEIAFDEEIGRFLIFRFFPLKEIDNDKIHEEKWKELSKKCINENLSIQI